MEGRTTCDDIIDKELGESVQRKWEHMNRDCLVNIFQRAGTEALIWSLPFVCRNWHTTALDPQCWMELEFKHKRVFSPHIASSSKFQFTKMVKFAVGRSQGTATKVVLEDFSSNDFFAFMTCTSESCPMLKSLILPKYGKIQKCTLRFIKKWNHLEHLTVPCQQSLFNEILTEISIHCKKFASLCTYKCVTYEATTAIVTLLPNIKALDLRECNLDRQNLVRIISQCRELELLDARDCVGFDADDAEILEMASHIKTFMSDGSEACEDDYYDSDDYPHFLGW